MENKYYLGKCDFNNSGRKNCKAFITWELKDGRFSVSAEIWDPRETDIYCGGQCVEEVRRFFPLNKQARRMAAIWKEWHLNDMQAGSPAQTEWLRRNNIGAKSGDYYTTACDALARAGLNPDPSHIIDGKPYVYGSAWLKKELPPEILAEIQSWETKIAEVA